MSNIVELSNTDHQSLTLDPSTACRYAEHQQVMLIKYPEISPSAANFPVFFTRDPNNGRLVLSALMAFENQQNLFVNDQQWSGTYQPINMRTYPLFLMRSTKKENTLTIGIDKTSNSISESGGLPLFDDKGSPSQTLINMQKLLETDLKNEADTQDFISTLEGHNLIRQIELVVVDTSGNSFNIAGLFTINEDQLSSLSAQSILALNQQGYLQQIHALLFSIYQVNGLIRRHNDLNNDVMNNKIAQVKIEAYRDKSGF